MEASVDSLPLSQDEIDVLNLVFACTGDHDLYDIVKQKVLFHRDHFCTQLTHIEAHTKNDTFPMRGFTTNDIRLILCRFSNDSVLGVQTKKRYVCEGTFLL